MSSPGFVEIDPLFGDGGAAIIELGERFGRYGMYSQEHVDSEIGRGLGQRHDAVLNHLRTGGSRRRDEPVERLAARTNYFREEYAYGTRPLVDGIEPFLFHDGFVGSGARRARPTVDRTGDRLRQLHGSGSGARGAHRRPRVPGSEPQAHAAVAPRRDAALRPLRGAPHADRDRRRLVPRCPRRGVRLLARRCRRSGGGPGDQRRLRARPRHRFGVPRRGADRRARRRHRPPATGDDPRLRRRPTVGGPRR